MRWLLTLAVLFTLTVPVAAQVHSAGRGMAAPRGGLPAGGRFSHRASGFSFHGARGFSHHRSGFGHRPFFPGRFRHRGLFFSASFGFPWYGGAPYWSYPGYAYPAMSYPDYSFADASYAADVSYSAAAEDQRRIEDRLDRLEERLSRLLDERREQPSSPPAAGKQAMVERSPATVLVFRDQHTEEVNNYAIVGGTMWVFTEERARKIRVADLDLSATTRQNEERGIEFQLN